MKLIPGVMLSAGDKQRLVEFTQSAPELLLHRARLILAYAKGKPTLQAAREAGISRGRARYWKRQFLARGMEIFSAENNRIVELQHANQALSSASDELLESPSSVASEQVDNGSLTQLPYPKPRQLIGINPDDTLAEAGKKVWIFHFAVMLSHEQGTLIGENIEELHDMRVATRRLRTAFDIFGPAFDPKTIKRHLKGLRKVGRVLGQVRDMDVILENGETYQKKLKEVNKPGLEPLLEHWKESIEQHREKMVKHLQSEAYLNFKQNFNLFLQVSENVKPPVSQEEGAYAKVRDTVPLLIYSRFAAVRAYESILSTASISQLHALRIEFKKFRYTLEYFKEVLGDGTNQAINEIKRLQDHLGELHDADVACQLVRIFLKDWDEKQILMPISERLNPEQVVTYLAYLNAERYRLISSFPQLWRRFSQPEFRQSIAQAISVL